MNERGLARLGLGLLLVLASCASDGGSSGTGITTAQGNIASVTPGGMGGLAGIRVAIEGTSLADETDAEGFFSVRGDYESEVTLLFSRSTDDLSARSTVNIPSGGTLTLNDVAIEAASGAAIPASQDVQFDGLVVAADCSAGRLTLVSQRNPTNDDQYTVVLSGSSLVDTRGQPVDCSALVPGQQVHLDGSVNPDGTFGDARIVVEASHAGG